MKNLEQLRAMHALAKAVKIGGGADGGQVVKKVPTMILANGFIAALAFAIEKGEGYKDVFNAIVDHLKVNRHMRFEGSLEHNLDQLCNSSSAALRAVTAESMAYLNYLRRFVK